MQGILSGCSNVIIEIIYPNTLPPPPPYSYWGIQDLSFSANNQTQENTVWSQFTRTIPLNTPNNLKQDIF